MNGRSQMQRGKNWILPIEVLQTGSGTEWRERCYGLCFCTKLCRRGIAAHWHAVAEDRPDGAVQCQVLPHGGCLPRGPGKYMVKRLFLLILSLFVMAQKIFVNVKKSVN
jgi:hypothetical protein